MKIKLYMAIALGLGLVLGAVCFVLGTRPTPSAQDHSQSDNKIAKVIPTTAPKAPSPPPTNNSEWQKYRLAREAALQANPALQAEYTDLLKEMEDQMVAMDRAMLKIDPKMGPVLSKLKALRFAKTQTLSSPKALPANQPPPLNNLTPGEWQELRTAHIKGLQMDAKLREASQNLAIKVKIFEAKINQRIIKNNPAMASLLPNQLKN